MSTRQVITEPSKVGDYGGLRNKIICLNIFCGIQSKNKRIAEEALNILVSNFALCVVLLFETIFLYCLENKKLSL